MAWDMARGLGKRRAVPPEDQVLYNYDLLELIFSFLDDTPMRSGPKYNDKRRNLISAALVCKVFFGPAMDILWRRIYTLRPLFCVIPTIQMEDGRYVAKKAITEENVARLRLYAQRIRYLALDDVERPIPPHIYYSILYLQQSCLFSSLSTFNFFFEKNQAPADVPSFSLFAGPALSSVTIRGTLNQAEEVIVASFLRDIHSVSPHNLRRLDLQGELTNVSLNYIEKFSKLKSLTLHLNSLKIDDLVDLFKPFPAPDSLQELNLKFNLDDSETAVMDSSMRLERVHLENLRTLIMRGTPSLISILLDSLRPRDLDTLKISFKVPGLVQSAEEMFDCVKKVVCSSGMQTLQSIHFHSDEGAIPLDAFALLRTPDVPNVKEINVRVDNLTGETMHTILYSTTSWSYLQTLTLLATRSPLNISNIWDLVQLCPLLTKLTISVAADFETRVLEEMQQRSELECAFPPLQELYLSPLVPVRGNRETLPCNDEMAIVVAHFIDHMFPDLKKITVHLEDVDRAYCELMEALVRQLRASRE
ncbi:hypothetical protein D9613_007121 [Agrocybe pediades]|uniref:F-box domain-containing protein n=1 Tax=Agrocybe pediades TaxID=84607 RepID=A0A8H4VK09_9AGAR|nr:hypothetical protein D9613_007121 [Agrocybe pediades]